MTPLAVGEQIVAGVGVYHGAATIAEVRRNLFGGTLIRLGNGWWMTAEEITPSLDGGPRLVTGRVVTAPD